MTYIQKQIADLEKAFPDVPLLALKAAFISGIETFSHWKDGVQLWHHGDANERCNSRSHGVEGMMKIGNLTQDQTVEVLKECINILPDDVLLEALSETLTMDQVNELVEMLP